MSLSDLRVRSIIYKHNFIQAPSHSADSRPPQLAHNHQKGQPQTPSIIRRDIFNIANPISLLIVCIISLAYGSREKLNDKDSSTGGVDLETKVPRGF